MAPLRLCRTCRHFIYRYYLMAGVPTWGSSCAHYVMGFPDCGATCGLFEREPGSDDE